jgi:hypothetical protein
MDEHRLLVVVGGDPPLGARQRVIDRALRARPAGLLPDGGDEFGQPAALFRACGQALAGRRPPDSLRGRAQDVVALGERNPEVGQRAAEALEEQGASGLVLAQQPSASLAAGQPQDRRLVVVGATGDGQLQHGRRAVVERQGLAASRP